MKECHTASVELRQVLLNKLLIYELKLSPLI